jgi:hypothetical protein
VADAELITDLASFYGKVGDFQWQLRRRVEAAHETDLNWALTGSATLLGKEIQQGLRDLISRVAHAIDDPPVLSLGLERAAKWWL